MVLLLMLACSGLIWLHLLVSWRSPSWACGGFRAVEFGRTKCGESTTFAFDYNSLDCWTTSSTRSSDRVIELYFIMSRTEQRRRTAGSWSELWTVVEPDNALLLKNGYPLRLGDIRHNLIPKIILILTKYNYHPTYIDIYLYIKHTKQIFTLRHTGHISQSLGCR